MIEKLQRYGPALFVCSILTVSVCASLAPLHWLADLASNFRLQYCLILLSAVLLFAVIRRWLLLLVCAACLISNGAPIVPYIAAADTAPADHNNQSLRILSLNVLRSNRDVDAVTTLINEHDPDFVVLLETNPIWQSALQPLLADYPHAHFVSHSGNFGIALLAKQRWTTLRVIHTEPFRLPSLVAEFSHRAQRLQLIATHPIPPLGAQQTRARDTQLNAMVEQVCSSCASLLVGDFNLTPWSPRFAQLLAAGALQDTARGFGIGATWHAFPGLIGGLKIDHILANSGVVTHKHIITRDVGSDHRGVLVDFSLALNAD